MTEDILNHPAAFSVVAPAHPPKIKKAAKEILAGILDNGTTKKILSAASPRPWKVIIGRTTPMRIDILDANGDMLAHFHPTSPSTEKTPNWENDAVFIVHLTEIINQLEMEKNNGSV